MPLKISDVCKVVYHKEHSLFIVYHPDCLIYISRSHLCYGRGDYYNDGRNYAGVEELGPDISFSFLRYRKTRKNTEEPINILRSSERFLGQQDIVRIFGEEGKNICDSYLYFIPQEGGRKWCVRYFDTKTLCEMILKTTGAYCKECGKKDLYVNNPEYICWACSNL